LDKEKELGEKLAQEFDRASRLVDDPVVIEYINGIAHKIALNSDTHFPITIRVVDSDVGDSFTLAGGFQYINTGLILQAEGEAELAGVLARGIAHTALRSATILATNGELMQLSTIPVIQLGPSGWSGSGNNSGQNLALPLAELKFRRDAQSSADFFALQYLYKAGYDPDSLPRYVERTSQLPACGKSIPKVFSPFPPASERVAAMKKEIARILPHRDDAVVTIAEFQDIKARLRALQHKQVPNSQNDPSKPTLRIRTDSPPPDSSSLALAAKQPVTITSKKNIAHS
jgi:predicted Zn-dependent protease